MTRARSRTCIVAGVLLLALLWGIAPLTRAAAVATAAALATPVKIGVLAHRGLDKALKDWTPTAEWLASLLPEYSFRIVPLTNDDIATHVASQDIDFLITNPASYATLEANFGIARIATLRNLRQGNPYTVFGAIILTRADRKAIRSLADLKGKSFMAVHPDAFGGWWMAKREMKDIGVEENDLGRLEFSGFPQDKIVYAVRDGKIDAGTVRTDLLERMAASGKIELSQFRILNPRSTQGFPFAHSTRLYPEWPFAMLKHTAPELAQNVAVSLLTISPDSPAAKAARIAGWTIPLDYNDVHALMKELHVGPYSELGKVGVADILRLYWRWILASIAAFVTLVAVTLYVSRLNRRLKHSNALLNTTSKQVVNILESTSDAYLAVDHDWRVTYLNGQAERLLKRPRESLSGKNLWDEFPEAAGQFSSEFRESMASGRQATFESYYPPLGRWFEINTHPTQTGMSIYFHDITEHKQAEQQRSQHAEQIRALYQVSSASGLTIDAQITEMLKLGAELLGMDMGRVNEIEPDKNINRIRSIMAPADFGLRRGQEFELDATLCNLVVKRDTPVAIDSVDDPEWREYAGKIDRRVKSYIGAPIRVNGRPYGTICFYGLARRSEPFNDMNTDVVRLIGRWVSAAIERGISEEELSHAKREAERANESKSSFLANMSHELRTPLNAIIGFSDVLGQRMFGELNDKQVEYVKDINVSGHHLLSLINDILDLSKVEAGRMELDLTRFDLPAAIDTAMTLVRERAARHGIALALDVDDRLGEFVADERKFKQILLNLLSNAVKFTPDGGRIAVSAKANGAGIEVAVSDNGPGISPEDQEAIFKDFYQVKTEAGRKEGTGLGLSLSRKFAELHGGTIGVQSALGEGSTFTLFLPAVAV